MAGAAADFLAQVRREVAALRTGTVRPGAVWGLICGRGCSGAPPRALLKVPFGKGTLRICQNSLWRGLWAGAIEDFLALVRREVAALRTDTVRPGALGVDMRGHKFTHIKKF